MKTFDIFFHDLKPETQARLLKFAEIKNVQEANWDVFPLTTYEIQEFECRHCKLTFLDPREKDDHEMLVHGEEDTSL
jgi:hypothetical protein